METIIKDTMLCYLQSANLITKDQHGFMKSHSTCSQLLECVHDWSYTLESNFACHVIYIDFKKAFDSVSHKKLIYKLTAYGFSEKLITWLTSFLSHRTQTVRVNSSLSDKINVTFKCNQWRPAWERFRDSTILTVHK